MPPKRRAPETAAEPLPTHDARLTCLTCTSTLNVKSVAVGGEMKTLCSACEHALLWA